ncbi:Caleosin related protein-domain-containing protein [Mycena rebaudengoi]|nr:Caleosin related protein-domain-containing protein [Mycena rebaudengoi]
MSTAEAPTRTMSPPLSSTAMNFPGTDQGMRPLLLRPTHPHANGSTSEQQKEAHADKVEKPRTALQSHAGFFDSDNDGIIWPLDTYNGFRALGFGVLFSAFAMVFVSTGLSWFTFGTLLPDPFFRIRVSNIHRAEHGSDSGSYTPAGELDERRFNYIFNLYTAPPHTHISFIEGVRMIRGNRSIFDIFGLIGAVFEWGATYAMDIHDVFDGSLFHRIAAKNAKKVH